MTRGEKIGGVVLGIFLFAGLFYLIYDPFLAVPYQELSTEPFLGGLDAAVEPGGEENAAAPADETVPADQAAPEPTGAPEK